MTRPAIFVGLLLALLAIALQGVQGDEELDQVPSEVQCRPYIEKALKDLGTGSLEESSVEVDGGVDEEGDEGTPPLNEQGDEPANVDDDDDKETDEQLGNSDNEQDSKEDDNNGDSEENVDERSGERSTEDNSNEADDGDSDNVETVEVTSVETAEDRSSDVDNYDGRDEKTDLGESVEGADDDDDDGDDKEGDADDRTDETSTETTEDDDSRTGTTINEAAESDSDEKINKDDDDGDSGVVEETEKNNSADDNEDSKADVDDDSKANDDDGKLEESKEATSAEKGLADNSGEDKDVVGKSDDDNSKETTEDTDEERKGGKEDATKESVEESAENDSKSRGKREIEVDEGADVEGSEESQEGEDKEPMPEEDLIQEIEVPENLRPRDHINQLLKLDQENEIKEKATQRVADIVLRDLKRLYDNAIKPLETLYKYRDLSNRHFGDPEIFSKPLVLFMGPWSGGKSSIINYLLDVEYKQNSLRTGGLQECLEEPCKPPNGTDAGAEPSPAYFNILMHGEEEEVLDGTQLAADWTFSGLQKFGQGMLDRLRGLRLNNKLLEKVNIVEIPGILEIRKQVQRLFPFNDACQWFIDRADIIFLVYDPSKLDVGPETEAILDQLKGREYQTRIVLNKADQVKPEELMRVQGALIWNISPLMSSAEPPIMYSVSLWSLPYEAGAPTRLLYAQERAFLRDLRSAIDKRVEHKIASARRFAVRVRNHAKMVDCYLTTYYNHKTFFGNKKEISDKIIENPQNYHIYEGLSTLTNISRYDLPDPDVYRDFFRLNSLYDFQPLSSTCTYFRGCPINRLDVAIAYDLPELVGKYKKSVETALHEGETSTPPS